MEVMTITSKNFEKEVMGSQVPVLIDFWASWCGPCKMMSPVIEEVAKELEGKAKVVKINVDEEQELASTFSIMSIPTLVIIENGRVKSQAVGVRSKKEVLDMF